MGAVATGASDVEGEGEAMSAVIATIGTALSKVSISSIFIHQFVSLSSSFESLNTFVPYMMKKQVGQANAIGEACKGLASLIADFLRPFDSSINETNLVRAYCC